MYLNTLVILSLTVCAVTPLKFKEFKFPGSCPKVKCIVDQDLRPMLGLWYRCFSTLDTNTCLNNEGETVYAYPQSSTALGVVICCRSRDHPDQVTCSREVGTGVVRPLSEPGRLSYESNGQTYPTVLLDVDDNYLVSYGCKSRRGCNDERDEQVYIYSRSYEQCASLERRSRNILKQNGISWSGVKTVKHGASTPYLQVPKSCPRS